MHEDRFICKYLDENSYYMNPISGSIAKGIEWEKDFADTDSHLSDDGVMSWEEWGGNTLIEVFKNKDSQWQEVN